MLKFLFNLLILFLLLQDTLTHKKISHDSPIKSVAFDWDPTGYKGKVKFVATVAQDGGTYWIRKVLKEVEV